MKRRVDEQKIKEFSTFILDEIKKRDITDSEIVSAIGSAFLTSLKMKNLPEEEVKKIFDKMYITYLSEMRLE